MDICGNPIFCVQRKTPSNRCGLWAVVSSQKELNLLLFLLRRFTAVQKSIRCTSSISANIIYIFCIIHSSVFSKSHEKFFPHNTHHATMIMSSWRRSVQPLSTLLTTSCSSCQYSRRSQQLTCEKLLTYISQSHLTLRADKL